MMINSNIKLGVAFCLLINLYAEEQVLWDLGMVINASNTIKYQKELNLDSLHPKQTTQKNIKALYSNNFIAPTVHEFKSPIQNNFNIIKTYDKLLEHLSVDQKIYMLKNFFLNKQYWKFLNLHGIVNENTSSDTPLEEMYVQNLYYTKKYKEALSHLGSIDNSNLTDMLLYYKIKTLIQLKQNDEALEQMTLFVSSYKNSDLLPYVEYDQKTIEMKNEN